MRWEALSAFATVAAAWIVWKQLGTLNNQLKLQHYSEYTKRYQSIVLNLPEDINDLNFKLNQRRKDYVPTMRHMRVYFDLCFEEWDLNRRELIDDESWKVWKDGIRTAMSKTAFQQAWKIVIATNTEYGADFQSFIDDAIPK